MNGYDWGKILELYEKSIVTYLLKKRISFHSLESSIQLIQTLTRKESQIAIVEMIGIPHEAYMALCGLARIRNLQECIEGQNRELVSFEYMIQMSCHTFLDGIRLGSAVGEAMGKLAVTTVDEIQRRTLHKSSKKATDSRYKLLRDFKLKAAEAAKTEWENGSSLLHHDMAKYLEIDYQDESGRHPFLHHPDGNNVSPSNVLRKVAKQVAKEMNRFDLISGQKKHHKRI